MYILLSCDDPGLNTILYVLKSINNIILIVVPILLIISLIIIFTKGVLDSENKQLVKKIKNSITALIIIFIIPCIVSIVMKICGNNYMFSDCWNNVSKTPIGNSNYIEIDSRTKKNVITDPSEYDSGSTDEEIIEGNEYNNIKVLKSFKLSDLKKTVIIPAYNGVNVAQSMALSDSYYITCSIKNGDLGTVIRIWTKNGRRVRLFTTNFNHCNGMTYNNKTDMVSATRFAGGTYSLSNFSLSKALNGKFKPIGSRAPISMSSVAYDEVSGNYYFGSGNYIYVTNGKMKIKKKIRKLRKGAGQDLGGYGGIIFNVYWVRGKSNSYVDMYKVSNGSYIGSYKFLTDLELESVTYDGSTLSVLFNKSGSPDYILTTNVNIS